MATRSSDKNIHAGHRKRIRERFCLSKESFSDHELLELMLCYAIPRSNTNETAHFLLDRFRSLEGVVNADIKSLQSIDGVGENASVLVTLIGETIRRIARQSCSAPKSYQNTQDLIAHIQRQFVGATVEKLYLFLFDNGLKLLGCVCLSEGIVNLVRIEPRVIMEHAIRHGASAVVLAHNHPGGVAVPSSEDVTSTHLLQTMLGKMNLELLEHFVIAGDRYLPILSCPNGTPIPVENSFYSSYLARHDADEAESEAN